MNSKSVQLNPFHRLRPTRQPLPRGRLDADVPGGLHWAPACPILPAMSRIVVREVRSAADLEQAQTIRCQVFVAEQGVAEALEIDGRDGAARHLLALCDGRPSGTLRLRWLNGRRIAKIERVAVLAAARGQGVGQALLRAALDIAVAEGGSEARLHAQTAAQAFYAGLGFVACGPEFEEDGIMHIAMRRALTDGDRQGLEQP